MAQIRVITGTVTGQDDKQPIPGVTVLVKNTTVGTITNLDGKYALTVPANNKILVFSYVGMKTQEVTIGSSDVINIVLAPDIFNMNEVVVTAIGIPRESKALSYSVQEVKSDEIQRAARTDLINSLQGKVSDVQIINSAGVAGSSTYITIRGAQSITGDNQPLFVIDGVPINNGGGEGKLDGVALSNRGIDINPDDVESVNVLKGGAATALYGLRAASGAIVITTKKGKATPGKKIAVTYNSSVTLDRVSQLPKRQNAYGQGIDGEWRSGQKYTWGPKLDTCSYYIDPEYQWKDFDVAGQIVSKQYHQNNGQEVQTYDPYDFFKTGVSTNNSISMTGGSDASNFYFSFSDNQSNGIIPNNKFRRNTFKLSGTANLTTKFKISGSANYIISSGKRIQQGSNTSGVMLGLLRTPSTFDNSAGYMFSPSYRLPDGSAPETPQRGYRHGLYYDNPYWTANMNSYKDKVNRLIGSFQMDYLPYSWLSFTYRLGVDWWGLTYTDDLAMYSGGQPGGWARRGSSTSKDFNSDLLMTIDKNITKDLNLKFVLGQNMTQMYMISQYPWANDLFIPEYYNLNNTTSPQVTEETSKIRRAGFYGDLQLAWKNMVYLSVTGRNDWSTTLPKNKNSFFYPSVGAGFIFTQLPGLKDNKVLPYGKIRASYAIVAKDAPAYYTNTYWGNPVIADGWTTGETWPFMGVNGYGWGLTTINQVQYSQIGEDKLKPEKTKTFETGIDLKFINNRVGLAYTYFNNKGEDLILQVPIASSTGYSYAILNAGSMRTTGNEITLDVIPIKNKNWEWSINVNWAKINTKVLALAPGIENLTLGQYNFTEPQIRAVVGQPYRTLYGFGWQRTADRKLLIGDDGYPMMDPNMKALANVDPDWTMGAGTSLRWKNLNLYVLFDIKAGGHMWNGTRGAMDHFGTSEGTANRDEWYLFEGVHADGTANTTQVKLDQAWRAGDGSGFTGPSEDYIEDANWVRLRTVTISYSFTSLLKKTFIKGLDIYITGTNLWLSTPYSGIDPETNLLGASNQQGIDYFNMPGTRSYTVGLSLSL